MYPAKNSRFREAKHVQVQANEDELKTVENDMRSLGAYRMSSNSRNLVEPDLTPRKLYGEFPAIPDTPTDYSQRPEKQNRFATSPKHKNKIASSPRQNRAIGVGRGRKSQRPLTRLEKEQEYAATKIQAIGRGRRERAKIIEERNRVLNLIDEQETRFRTEQNQTNERDFSSSPKSRQSLRQRRRNKSREKSTSRNSQREAESFPLVVDQPESDETLKQKERNYSSNANMIPSQPESPNSNRRSPSPRRTKTRENNQGRNNSRVNSRASSRVSSRGRASPSSPTSPTSPTSPIGESRNESINIEAVEQLRLKLKQACTTHKGCEPTKIFDKWDKDKDGELDRDEVFDGLKKLFGRNVLREWNMFDNFFAYIDTDGNNSIDRDEFAEFVTHRPQGKVRRKRSLQYDSPKQVFEGFHGTFQGDKHKGGQKGFGSYGDVDKRQKTYYKERTGMEPIDEEKVKKTLKKALNFEEIDFAAVEQLRLKLKIACTTHKGCEPSRIFDKWDKDKDGELDRDEVLEGMNKMLGKDVLSEWNMFDNFFAYVDLDGDGTIDRDEFAEFITHKPDVKVTRRRSEQYDSPKQVFEGFHGTFQGDKHKGGQRGFSGGSTHLKNDAWDYKQTFNDDEYDNDF